MSRAAKADEGMEAGAAAPVGMPPMCMPSCRVRSPSSRRPERPLHAAARSAGVLALRVALPALLAAPLFGACRAQDAPAAQAASAAGATAGPRADAPHHVAADGRLLGPD